MTKWRTDFNEIPAKVPFLVSYEGITCAAFREDKRVKKINIFMSSSWFPQIEITNNAAVEAWIEMPVYKKPKVAKVAKAKALVEKGK